ncbi:hypothetical protein N8D56_05530 [Devosia sp. A8/3-2]|nr:hypothetical protein N8D56_05530 [Devosia sp. A8/3-2]
MANDLSTPLTGRKRQPGETGRGFPVARALCHHRADRHWLRAAADPRQ